MASLSLVFDLLVRDRASRDLGNLGNVAERTGGRLTKTGAAIGSAIGNVAAQGITAGLSAITNFASGSVDAFAAVEDATGAAGVQFGKSLPDILEFADKAFESFGLSKRAALDAQNTFGTLGKAAGLAGPDLSQFAGNLTGLAGDLASFKGTSTEQAIEAVGAALRGETEPIRAYGVLLDDAALRQEALALGLIKTTKDALTPQQKTLAAQSAILKQTTDAQGDFARTSDSTANTQKRLQAATENAQAVLGEKLAPALTAVRGTFLGLIQGASGFIDVLTPVMAVAKQAFDILFRGDFTGGPLSEDSAVVDKLFTIREALERVGGIAKQAFDILFRGDFTGGPLAEDSKVVDVLFRIREAFEGFAGFIRANLQPVIHVLTGAVGGALLPILGALAALVAGPVIAAVGAFVGVLASPVVLIGALVGAVVYAYKHFGEFREVVDKAADVIVKKVVPAFVRLGEDVTKFVGMAVDYVRRNWPIIRETIEDAIDRVTVVVKTFTVIVGALWKRFGDELFAVVRVAFDFIKGTVQNALNLVLGIFKTVGALIRGDWSGVWDGLKQIAGAALAQIGTVVGAAFGAIKVLFATGLEVLRGLFSLGWAALTGIVTAAWAAILGAVTGAWAAIRTAVSTAIEGLIAHVQTFPGRFVTGFGLIWTAVKNAIPAAFRLILGAIRAAIFDKGGIIDKVKGWGEDIVDALVGGIKRVAGRVGSAIKDAFKVDLPNINLPSFSGDGPGRAAGGSTLRRVQSMLPAGLRVTSTYRTPAENARVGGSPTSYHKDRNNPAVDIGGPTHLLDAFYKQLVATGPWRELLWRVPGHYDHVHVAHQGGRVDESWTRSPGDARDERTTRLQVGETVLSAAGTDDLVAVLHSILRAVESMPRQYQQISRAGAGAF